MKRIIILSIALFSIMVVRAQRITRDFKGVSMSMALKEIEASTNKYTINFIYNELEDFTVTKNIQKKSVPDAIQEVIGLYPIKMTIDGNSIFVECINKSERKLIGKLVDTNNQPVPFANVALLNLADSTFITGGVSNEGGNIVIPCNAEKVNVRITCVGYYTFCHAMTVGNVGTIRMIPSTNILSTVVVKGDNIIKKDDRTVYLPTKKQVNSTNSGVGLLFNLMVPQLRIDKMDNKITTNDGQNVTVCIDDRKTSIKEVNQLRPRDIARVEFQNYPTTGIYAGERAVVNFITKKYETGGYVDVRSENRVIYNYGTYDAKLNIDHKKMNYTVLTGTTYDDNRKSGSDLIETYNFASGQIVRTQQFMSGKLKKEVNYGLVRAEYKGKTMKLWSEFGFLWTQNPSRRGIYDTSYEPQVLASSVTTNDVYTKSAKPYAEIYFMKKYSDNEKLNTDIEYIYTHNNYNRTNVEGSNNPIVNNSKEDYHDVSALIDYSKAYKHQNSIRIEGAEYFKKSIGDYSGSNSSHQNLTTSEMLGFASYTQGFGKNLNIMGRLGFDYTVYKLNQNKQKTFFNPRANLYINYNVNKISSLSFTSDYGNSWPQMSYTSEVTQKVNPLMILKGNPDLKIVKYLDFNLNYDLSVGNFDFNAYSSLTCCFSNPAELYYENNGNMIHTYTSDCNFFYLNHGISNTFYMLEKSLQLQTGVDLNQSFVKHECAGHLSWFVVNAKLSYMTGDFSFGALYNSKEKDLLPYYIQETNQDYGLWVTFNHKGFYAEAGARRPFNGKYTRSWYDFGKYSYVRKDYSDAAGPFVYLKLSYTFDFGRKVTKNDVKINRSTNSGMLHP
jgi:hypothetical protein